jgi:hypothetical protein
MTTTWYSLDKRFRPDHLGYLTEIIVADDSRPVREQLEDRYRHGGGWRPITGFRLNRRTMVLTYPEDPPFYPIARTQIGNETVFFYPQCSLLLIMQEDGSYAVTRVD